MTGECRRASCGRGGGPDEGTIPVQLSDGVPDEGEGAEGDVRGS